MTEQEIQEAARHLIELHNDEYEFCLVYEDEEYCELDHETQQKIHDAMYSAKVTVTFE